MTVDEEGALKAGSEEVQKQIEDGDSDRSPGRSSGGH